MKYAVLFLLVGIFMYWPSLNHPFMIDDHTLFDATMNDIRNLPYQFLPDKAKALGIGDGPGDVYYRPLALAIPMLCRVAFGPWVIGYHAFNIVLFAAAAWSIHYFFRALLGNGMVAFLTALFFLMHPVNGLLVNHITASVFSAQVIFMLLSLYFFIKSLDHPSSFILHYFLPIVFFILAMMCHESAMALPLYAFAVSYTLNRRVGTRFIASLRPILPMLIILVFYLWWRMDHLSLKLNILDKYAQFHMSVFECAATVVKLAGWYVRQLGLSDGLVVIWLTPVVRAGVGLWLLGGAAALSAAGYLFIRAGRHTTLRLGLLWFVTGFVVLPFAGLYHMPQMMVEPHWFIFSVIGFFLCLAWAVQRLLSKISRPLVWGALALLMASWFLSVQSYNQIWSTELGYCQWWLSRVPQFRPIHATVARAYFAMGKLKEARQHYNQVIFNSHSDFLIYTNLGTIDLLEGDIVQAKAHLHKAVSIESNAQTALNTLGVIAVREKDYSLARSYFMRAAHANPFAAAPKRNLRWLDMIEKSGRRDDPQASKINFNVPL